jgi:hypothetical protein
LVFLCIHTLFLGFLPFVIIRVVNFGTQIGECPAVGALEHGVIGRVQQATNTFVVPDMGTSCHE